MQIQVRTLLKDALQKHEQQPTIKPLVSKAIRAKPVRQFDKHEAQHIRKDFVTVEHARKNSVSARESLTDYSAKRVVEVIIDQIQSIDRHAFLAWGAKQYVVHDNVAFNSVHEEGKGLGFNCSGGKFKGRILILLTQDDLYNIFAYTIRATKINVKRTERGICAEDLVKILDDIIG